MAFTPYQSLYPQPTYGTHEHHPFIPVARSGVAATRTKVSDVAPVARKTRLGRASSSIVRRRSAPWQQKIVEQNAQDSPFLRLPPEIRNTIYELALSHKVLHMSVRSTLDEGEGCYSHREYAGGRKLRARSEDQPHLRVTHVICRLPLKAQDDAYDLSNRAPAPLEHDQTPETYVLQHAECYTDLSRIKVIAKQCDTVSMSKLRHQQVNLAFLRTCKQIHDEASLLPYTDNAFAFHESETFNLFVRNLGAVQREALATIHIDGYVWCQRVLKCFNIPTVRLLKGLRTLHFTASALRHPTEAWNAGNSIFKFNPVLAFAVLQQTTVFKVTYTYDTCERKIADRAGRRNLAWSWEQLLRTYVIQTAAEKRNKRKREGSPHAHELLPSQRGRFDEVGLREELILNNGWHLWTSDLFE